MARVDWKVSATPIAQTGASSEGGGGLQVETVTLDVKGGVGGGNSKGVWAGTDIANWANGVCTHVNAGANVAVSGSGDDLVYIEHTGKVFDSSITTGKNINRGADGTLVPVEVRASTVKLAELHPGEAMVFPRPAIPLSVNCTVENETSAAVKTMVLS